MLVLEWHGILLAKVSLYCMWYVIFNYAGPRLHHENNAQINKNTASL